MAFVSNSLSAMQQFQQRKDPDLIVSGYSRRHCSSFVPVAVRSIMEAFYTMWMQRKLSCDEVKQLCANQPINLHCVRLNGSQIRMTLRVVNDVNHRQLQCRMYFPPDIEYVAGLFGGTADTERDGCCKPIWKRHVVMEGESHPFAILYAFSVPTLRSKLLGVSTYFDIMQIKYAEKVNRVPFNIPRQLKRRGRVQWIIDNKDISRISKRKPLSFRSESGWEFTMICKERWRGLMLFCTAPFLPLDVKGWGMTVNVRYVMNGKQGSTAGYFHGTGHNSYEYDFGWTTKNIGESKVELNIEFEVEYLTNLERGLVPESDWVKIGVY